MSELKADNTFVFGEECLAYKKSEADKVIAEKDKEIMELKAGYKETYDKLQTATMKLSLGLGAKADVDAYITNMNKKHAESIKAYQLKLDEAQTKRDFLINNLLNEKRKRCLAMAKRCFTKSNYHFVLARHGEDTKENNRKSILYSKWQKRWLELAEKFKDKE